MFSQSIKSHGGLNGGAGIRTLETLAGLPVFKTGKDGELTSVCKSAYDDEEKCLDVLLGAISPELPEIVKLLSLLPVEVRSGVVTMLRAITKAVSSEQSMFGPSAMTTTSTSGL